MNTRANRPRRAVAAVGIAAVLLAGCSAASGSETAPDAEPAAAAAESEVWDSSFVHEIEVTFDEGEYAAMVETYSSTGDKEWIRATVTIDGTTFENAGLRLKGNSSLRGASADTDPTTLPWLIRLDQYVDGQSLDGYTQFVVRSNNSETSLNEAVALELLDLAGLATQEAIATRFSVNGAGEQLRLVVQNPDDTWDAENFATDGILYKAESTGDYGYRGDDPDAYDEVFDQETNTDNEDVTPLIEFLDFVNNSSDEEFAEQLDEHLDVEAFATYLAVQELIGNFDDIDGPGNNSYLRYDAETGMFTVVAWDHNLAFGGMGRMGPGGFGEGRGDGGPPATRNGEMPEPPDGMELPEDFTAPEGMEIPEDFQPPEGMEFPEDFAPPGGGRGGEGGGVGFGGRSNPLVERFLADETYSALYEDILSELREQLYGTSAAQNVLDSWVEVLTEDASDLVDAATIDQEADAIAGYFTTEE
jgi:spore coat protein CotH